MCVSKMYLVHLPPDVPGRSLDERPDAMLLLASRPEDSAPAYEAVYMLRGLRQLGAVRWVVPAAGSKTALLDAALAFCPAAFRDCAPLREVERQLRHQSVLDFRSDQGNVPEAWEALQRTALPRFADLTIYEGRPSLVKRQPVLPRARRIVIPRRR